MSRQSAAVTSLKEARAERVPFRLHPRVFAALGADLVTDDVVAVIELVKNSWDAGACKVHLAFGESSDSGPYLELLDDGCGMTKQVIDDVWCVVATPHKSKSENRFAGRGKSRRRVVGEKGLGRLSAARLGERLQMVTKAVGDECWAVEIDWSRMTQGDDISESFVLRTPLPNPPAVFRSGTGTLLRILGLKRKWDEERIEELKDGLSRLLSPFSAATDFRIFVDNTDGKDKEVEIGADDFLAKPKYRIKGDVDEAGNVSAIYEFTPLEGDSRKESVSTSWRRIYEGRAKSVKAGSSRKLKRTRADLSRKQTLCGPFDFEIRAWDLDPSETDALSDRFGLSKRRIRNSIAAHKGISVYRDGVLVLPKSESARDWLGLDLRRVSRLGPRLSTSQIVGYVSISADGNPGIKDTSDRERLASCREVTEFEEILRAVVGLLQTARDRDRYRPGQEKPLRDLFESLDATELVSEVETLAREGAGAAKAVPVVERFMSVVESARTAIEERFVYYSRLATVGTIAHMLLHEIMGRTMLIGDFLTSVRSLLGAGRDRKLISKLERADRAVDALERLADTFSPLASGRPRRRRGVSVLEERIAVCLEILADEIKDKRIRCRVPDSSTKLAIDPGELDAILLNLVLNAAYWMADVPKDQRALEFKIEPAETPGRVRVLVEDTGSGIAEEDTERVFWPGVTRKPDGIGMGLTVASELVAAYHGQMGLQADRAGNGACFIFDLPLAKKGAPRK